MKRFNVLICGVGGQGIMTLGMLLKQAAMPAGMQIWGGEMRGLAQMEGAVTSSVRYLYGDDGEGVDERRTIHSGAIPYGGADLVIAVEPVEAMRSAHLFSGRSIVVLNTYTIKPKSVDYPEFGEILENVKRITDKVYVVDANDISMERYGTYRMANYILLGVALAHTDFPIGVETIEDLLPGPRELEAFRLGMTWEGEGKK